MRIILLGPPGAGKGTQAKQLSFELDLAHIATGDLLRFNVSEKTVLGLKAQEYMNKGLLVPDDLVIQMLKERFMQADVKKGFILDGFPRTIQQAIALDDLLKNYNWRIDFVFNLDCSEKVIIQRLSGRLVCKNCGANFHISNMPPKRKGICDLCGGQLYQRTDDNEETIRKRLAVYQQESAPLIDYYTKQGLLRQIQADRSQKEVLEAMVSFVKCKNDCRAL
ncbi:MAG: adenylate kinase [Candidatus Omnitrophica bacterium]|nr:adenylate kinase [Candidatus Omnitrophota bacterium]